MWRYQVKRVKSDFGDGYEYTVEGAFQLMNDKGLGNLKGE